MFARTIRTRAIISAGVLLVTAMVLFLVHLSSSVQADPAFAKDNLLRLHIIANSNSPADQDLKLKVRDAVREAASEIFAGIASKTEAKRLVRENWTEIEAAAEATIQAEGFEYPVRLELGVFTFPDRRYGELFLPSGDYEALRVVIGEGKGENWWCVLFPPLCLVGSDEDLEAQKMVSVNSELEDGEVQYRFRWLELMRGTKYAERINEWWQVSRQSVGTMGLPLIREKI